MSYIYFLQDGFSYDSIKSTVMKRDIKFRAWDLEKMLYPTDYGHGQITSGWILNHYSEVMQFTGINDKNLKEVYEGDIVKCIDHPTNIESGIGYVYYEQGEFKVDGLMIPLGHYRSEFIEVIGNVFENKELLYNEKNI